MTSLDIEGIVIAVGLGITTGLLIGHLLCRYIRQRIRGRENW